MTPEKKRPGVLWASRNLLNRHDRVYLSSLLVPFVVCDLALKISLILAWPKNLGFVESLGLMRSDFLFNLGYIALWAGLFAVAKKGVLRWIVVGLFHAVTIFAALIAVSAYQYFKVTGSTLDSNFMLFSLSSPEGLGDVVASEVDPGLLVLLLIVLAYAIAGPWLATRLVGWWRGWPESGGIQVPRFSRLHLAGFGLAVCVLFALSLLPGGGGGIGSPSKSFSRDAFVNVAMTAADGLGSGIPSVGADEAPQDARLIPTEATQRRNVVLIHLESTSAQSLTPYNKVLDTSPFLDDLAKTSLLAERAYAVVPHTTNALAATNCGVDPPLNPWQTSSLGDRAPTRCLADLLMEQGYDTAWFTSSVSTFEIERLPELVENLGYKGFYPVETMDTEGFEKANYFGYEDDVMLEPSEKWLSERGEKPFIAVYETIGPHHQYLAPQDRYGRKEFDEDDEKNRYLNSIRNQDFFLKNLFEQYRELGLYEETIFVIYGDHGEAFGEHGRYQHDNVPYEEGLRVPLVIHDPARFRNRESVEDLVSQLDILPTVVDLLGYELEGGPYKGTSLLQPVQKRTLMASCWNESGCLVSIEGSEKYIYHFEDSPDEVFDLSEDPEEQRNLAQDMDPEELEERRQELLEWRARVSARYGASE